MYHSTNFTQFWEAKQNLRQTADAAKFTNFVELRLFTIATLLRVGSLAKLLNCKIRLKSILDYRTSIGSNRHPDITY